jgi:hypothetical protein
MGLAVEVGVLADLLSADPEGADLIRAELDAVNRVLSEHHLPLHQEPVALPELDSRTPVLGYPYSFLHYLRRAAAHAFADPSWRAEPLPEGQDPAQDPVLQARYELMDSHLLCHSDVEGYYLPQDFPDVLFTQDEAVPGGMIGSSPRLMAELVEIAPALGIRLTGTGLSDEEAGRLTRLTDSPEGIWRELIVWLSLYEAARLSIAHGTAVSFQ